MRKLLRNGGREGGGGGFEPPTKFSKRAAWQDLNFEVGVAGKGGVTFFRGVAILQKNKKLKSEIFNDKKSL